MKWISKALVKRLTETAKLPTKAHFDDLAFDLYADESCAIQSGSPPFAIKTGIAIEFPDNFGGVIKDRSSLASTGILTCGGVIDPGYRGEIIVLMRSLCGTFYIGKGQKIAQLILIPRYDVEFLETTEPFLQTVRGDKGFGSSGA